MEYGICGQAVVPVRLQPGDQQEMINQLLFGDLVVIKGHVKEWILIETFDDQYEGWIDKKQITYLDKTTFNELIVTDRHYSLELSGRFVSDDNTSSVLLTIGSRLPHFQDSKFMINGQHYQFTGEVQQTKEKSKYERLINIATKYLEAPYLWGGRSPCKKEHQTI